MQDRNLNPEASSYRPGGVLSATATPVSKSGTVEDTQRLQEYISQVRELRSQGERITTQHFGPRPESDKPEPPRPSPEALRWAIQLLGEELNILAARLSVLESGY